MKRIVKNRKFQVKGVFVSLPRGIFASLQFVLILSLLHCPKDLPQQELSEARIQLSAAEEEGASTTEAQLYGDAKTNLLEAHQLMAEEEFSGAKEKAQVSLSLAMDAREKAMPAYLSSLDESALGVLASMERQGAAENNAESFELAALFYKRAQKLREEGDSTTEQLAGTQGEQKQSLRRKALGQYRTASLSYKQVKGIGDMLEDSLRAQGTGLGERIRLVKVSLEKARRYGATEDQLKGPASQLGSAEKDYKAKKYKDAKKSVESAEKGLSALLAKLEPAYARKMLEEAKSSVAKAEAYHGEADTPEERQDPKKDKALDIMKEQLASAQEARDTAESLLGEENYSDSIKESEDALRLSKVILEQGGLLAASSERGAKLTSDGNGLVEDIGGGWKRYTVRDLKPADCLWCIAVKPEVYGSGVLWERIHKANRGRVKNPNVIHPGQVLLIPPREGPITQPPSPGAQQAE